MEHFIARVETPGKADYCPRKECRAPSIFPAKPPETSQKPGKNRDYCSRGTKKWTARGVVPGNRRPGPAALAAGPSLIAAMGQGVTARQGFVLPRTPGGVKGGAGAVGGVAQRQEARRGD